MGVNVNIFGYIDCPGRFWKPYSQNLFQFNKEVLDKLPPADHEPPFITKDMFSMMQLSSDDDLGCPQYESHLIHFAGSYKNMYQIETGWLRKFESILAQLCWNSAVAINDFSHIQCRWAVEQHMVEKLYTTDPPQPPTKWSFSYSHLVSQTISEREAFGYNFSSVHHLMS